MLKLLASEWFEPPSGEGARLLLRGLTGLEWLTLEDLLKKADTTLTKISKGLIAGKSAIPTDVMRHVLAAGVRDWDGIGHPDGSPWLFEDGAAANLPIAQAIEAFGRILERSMLDADAVKN